MQGCGPETTLRVFVFPCYVLPGFVGEVAVKCWTGLTACPALFPRKKEVTKNKRMILRRGLTTDGRKNN